MNNTAALHLNKSISNIILNFEYHNINTAFLKKYIKSLKYSESFRSMFEKKSFTCKNVLSLCEDILNKMVEDNKIDWLNTIYDYTLSLAFPRLVNTNFNDDIIAAARLYLEILHEISEYQKASYDNSFQSKYPLNLLSEDMGLGIELSDEYTTFKNSFRSEYIYEMMKLNYEILGFNTLDHICGVHFLAVHVGIQFLKAGIPIDLGRVSGAAAGHDIGKYGCDKTESSRIAYLHYFYTDMWFKKHNIDYIRHIAVNHSTWDLELENLPLESLILIYCDFRVKNRTSSNGTLEMHIFNLKDSFDVILNKLDNLDEKKIKRYERVYSKLKDFEDYMLNLGFSLNPDRTVDYKNIIRNPSYNSSIVQGNLINENFKYFSINHNINLMYKLRDEFSLNSILEQARSQSDWKNLRQYLYVFEEYSTYLTPKQKLITLKFLYENLTHQEEDIRRRSADLIGEIIANFDTEYRKEIPKNIVINESEQHSKHLLDKYLNQLTSPDHKLIPLHKKWINYSILPILGSLFKASNPKKAELYRKIFIKYISRESIKSNDVRISLLKAIKVIPHEEDEEFKIAASGFIISMLLKSNPQLRICAIKSSLDEVNKNDYLKLELEKLFSSSFTRSRYPAENYLRLKLLNILELDSIIKNSFIEYFNRDSKKISDIYLSNLKTDTDWVIKKVNVDLLLEHSLSNIREQGFYTAMHFCNLLKVSALESVRNNAGNALIKLIPYLSFEQRNDVAVELIRALEIEGYPFAEYIPYYLGQVILFLKPKEFDEMIDEFIKKIKHSEPRICSLMLGTIGIAVSQFTRYRDNLTVKESTNNKLLVKMLGVLMNGLVHYNVQVRQVAFRTIGKDIFASKYLTLEDKKYIYKLCAKKTLTLLKANDESDLELLINSAGLNHIYRFINDYNFYIGNIDIKSNNRVAFFPGTFDPFSLSHKEIAVEIQNMGFDVFLAVDEFSWSKRTLPNLIRRNIISMSIADQLNIFLYPEKEPVNIANYNDLNGLKNSFPDSEVYIVVGSDVVHNASAYKNKEDGSIHSFNHIIFQRIGSESDRGINTVPISQDYSIDGKVIMLNLPPQYESISSTQIRNFIDLNRDISSLIDPMVQKYIYENGFYQSEPQFKTLIQHITIDIDTVDKIGQDLVSEMKELLNIDYSIVNMKVKEFNTKASSRAIILRSAEDKKLIGFSLIHWLRTNKLFQEFKDNKISQYIRENSVGRILCIDGLFIDSSYKIDNLDQILLAETISFSLSRDYDYAVFNNTIDEYHSHSFYETLELFGFSKINCDSSSKNIYTVNMNAPCTLDLDLLSVIKEPYRSNPYIIKTVQDCRKRLQRAITKLYPGQLVLSFDRKMLYQNLIKKVCRENHVPHTVESPRKLGSAMCVPFGNILKGNVVPNTVTKSLHTEKFFTPDVKKYTIGPFPYYPDFSYQIKMLKSFGKPIILVDDILHKGYRLNVIYPLLNMENINVQKIIVGILSGRGKELADAQGKAVDSVYFIPKLKVWFNESALYPFMGGDTLWRGIYPERNLIPSINLILPYTSPSFIRGASKESLYNLSEVCIENALSIFETIENEYQRENERALTLSSLGKIFVSPRCPDHGKDMNYDLNLGSSNYIRNDLELLKRLEHILK